MWCSQFRVLRFGTTFSKRYLNSSAICLKKREHPFSRTVRILSNDLKMLFAPFTPEDKRKENESTALADMFPSHVDILVIGGGVMGSSVAYYLKERTGLNGLNVAVLEKDPTYSKSSTVLSVGGLRQQFSLPENIHMSLYGAEFIRKLKRKFGPDADVQFHPNGYLMLAAEHGAQILMDNSKLQNELGAINIILTPSEIKERFPWMDTTGVELGCLGLEKEGWFDPWAFLHTIRQGAIEKGAQYINGEVVDFVFRKRYDIVMEEIEGRYEGTNEIIVQLPNGEQKSITFAYCIIAAGAQSGEVAKLARIGTGTGLLSCPLPVEKRKRYVYCFHSNGGPTLDCPMTIDYTGAYFRREGLGGVYIGGMSPQPEDEPPTDNLDVDYNYFDEKVWPYLAQRVPAFNQLKVRSAWAGFYDFNEYDENGIIGNHPYYSNIFFATGFSGHGIQQAPAVGRAISELILESRFKTLDLTRLGFDRLLVDKPMFEVCIV